MVTEQIGYVVIILSKAIGTTLYVQEISVLKHTKLVLFEKDLYGNFPFR